MDELAAALQLIILVMGIVFFVLRHLRAKREKKEERFERVRRRELLAIAGDVRHALAAPDNCFLWSSWTDAAEAVAEVDALIAGLRSRDAGCARRLHTLLLTTGPVCEVATSSGWDALWMELAERCDEIMLGTSR